MTSKYILSATIMLAVSGSAFAAQTETATVKDIDTTEVQEAAPAIDMVPASSQPLEIPEAATIDEKPTCELHIFPTLEGQAMTTGWLSGFGAIGAVADAAANKSKNENEGDYLRDALGPEMQVQALKSIDLLAELNLPPSQIIFQEPIADRKITTKSKTRLTESKAACYVEFLVTQNFYRKAAIYGRSLNNRFIFKDFRDGLETTKMIKGRGGNGLKHFPPKTPEETEAAEADLQQAFIGNLTEFAKKFKKKKR